MPLSDSITDTLAQGQKLPKGRGSIGFFCEQARHEHDYQGYHEGHKVEAQVQATSSSATAPQQLWNASTNLTASARHYLTNV